MRIVQLKKDSPYLKLIPEDGETIDTSRFMGTRRSRGTSIVEVENNLVNRIVLNHNVPKINYRTFSTDMQEYLRDYQTQDIGKLLCLRHSLNLNPMGLGKTIETIVLARELAFKNAVFIVPKVTIPQWIEQLHAWWPEFGGDIVEYIPRKTKVTRDNIYVLNYEKFQNVETQRLFKSFVWDCICVDEAHKIKNPKSQRTKNIKDLPAKQRMALTGTPILNRPDDLWSILNFCDPFYSGRSYWNFVDYFCNAPYGHFGREIKGLTKDPEHIEVLNKLLDIVSVRNSVRVAPEKSVVTIPLDMLPKQKDLYDKTKQLLLDELPNNLTIANGMALSLRLQQLTSWPALFEGYEKEHGIKFAWIKDLCDNNPNEKIVVYTKFAKTANALNDYLCKYKIGTTIYTGGISTMEQRQHLRNFMQDADVQVLIGTIGALGTGVDGLQHVSRIAVFVEREWSPEINKQCEDRLSRYGQKKPVMCYYLECKKSWDRHVGRVNMSKAEDIRRALDD